LKNVAKGAQFKKKGMTSLTQRKKPLRRKDLLHIEKFRDKCPASGCDGTTIRGGEVSHILKKKVWFERRDEDLTGETPEISYGEGKGRENSKAMEKREGKLSGLQGVTDEEVQ